MSTRTPELSAKREIEPNSTNYFRYFITNSGIIGYFHDDSATPIDGATRATLVYFPDSNGNKVCEVTGDSYSKVIINGAKSNVPSLSRIDPSYADEAFSWFMREPFFREPIVAVPHNEVAVVFDHRARFKQVVSENTLLGDALRLAVSYFEQFDIPSSELGLYGGVQACVKSKGYNSGARDLDITVTGSRYVPRIMRLSRKFQVSDLPDFSQTVSKRNNRRRLQLSSFELPSGIKIDTKIIRARDDILPKSLQGQELETTTEVSFWAQINDCTQGFSSPSLYHVNDILGNDYQIYGRSYDATAVAGNGDIVFIRGTVLPGTNIVVLVEPDEHYITSMYPSTSLYHAVFDSTHKKSSF